MPDSQDRPSGAPAQQQTGPRPGAPQAGQPRPGQPSSAPSIPSERKSNLGRTGVAPAAPAIDTKLLGEAIANAANQIEQRRLANTPTPNMDETVPGGVYIHEGRVVDANNNPRELPEDADAGDEGEVAPAPRKEP